MIYDIAIIGGGPAGILAALTASKSRKRVILIEKNPVLGKKILATGNGRCNITNKNTSVERYHGADNNFIQSVIAQFNQHETIKFFESLGLILKEEDNGRMFPRNNQASSVVNVLEQELNERGIILKLNTEVKNIHKDTNWKITTNSNENIFAKKIIITTGGKAAFIFGSSGDGLFWAKKLGHSISPIHAALVPIETKEEWVREIQGIKIEALVRIIIDNKEISHKFGDLLFTHFGISGPAIMSQARNISKNINKRIEIKIDLFSELSNQELDQKITFIFNQNGKKNIKNSLLGIIPQNMIPLILNLSKIDETKKAAEISKQERSSLITTLKNLTLTVKNVRPLKDAQVSAGGIETKEISKKTLESTIVSDLYFAGEIIDVDGDSGGFNLQWAWSSGFVAGLHSSNS